MTKTSGLVLLANVNSSSRSLYVVVCLSVVCLSVCLSVGMTRYGLPIQLALVIHITHLFYSPKSVAHNMNTQLK